MTPPLSLKRAAAPLLLAVTLLLACGDTPNDGPYASAGGAGVMSPDVGMEPPRAAEPPPPPPGESFTQDIADAASDLGAPGEAMVNPSVGAQVPGALAGTTTPGERMLKKDGVVSFAVSSVDSARWRIAAAVEREGGYLSEERVDRHGKGRSLALTARVPAGRFDAVLEQIGRGVSDFDERSVTVADLTAEYVDLAARLRTRRALEDRYRALLTRADDVEDVLAVERQLGEVREQVEAAEGQLRYLTDRTAMSTLHVRVYERDAATGATRANQVVASLAEGWDSFAGFLLALISVWPFVLLLAGGAYLLARRRQVRA